LAPFLQPFMESHFLWSYFHFHKRLWRSLGPISITVYGEPFFVELLPFPQEFEALLKPLFHNRLWRATFCASSSIPQAFEALLTPHFHNRLGRATFCGSTSNSSRVWGAACSDAAYRAIDCNAAACTLCYLKFREDASHRTARDIVDKAPCCII
jgi:hypothetical protein